MTLFVQTTPEEDILRQLISRDLLCQQQVSEVTDGHHRGQSGIAEFVLGRALSKAPQVAEAYALGELSMSKAEQVVRVATPPTVQAWIHYARHTTVRRLRFAVQEGMRARREDHRKYEHLQPPPLDTLSDPEAQAFLEATLARIKGTGAPQDPRAEVSEKPTCARDSDVQADTAPEPTEKPTCAGDSDVQADSATDPTEKPTCAGDADVQTATAADPTEKPTCAGEEAAEAGSPVTPPFLIVPRV